jgi:D-alanine-D-alanine ligase
LREAIAWAAPQAVFNLVESVNGKGKDAHLAPRLLDLINMPYTGARPFALEISCDKIKSKRLFRDHDLPTPSFALPPDWETLDNGRIYIVKSVDEDASFGLDDGAVARGWDVPARARKSEAEHGGQWFAEEYMPGREFNVSLIDNIGGVQILPIAEMRFENWAEHRPRIVGYGTKWNEKSADAKNTQRRFGCEKDEPELAARLIEVSRKVWEIFELTGYARIDFRLDEAGNPMLLELNPNPCIAPDAGFAAASERAGLSYARLIERIAESA